MCHEIIIDTSILCTFAGDNILTAVSVARDCGMVAPYEHVIQLSFDGDPQLGILNRQLIGAPQSLPRGSLTPSSVSCTCVAFIFTNRLY